MSSTPNNIGGQQGALSPYLNLNGVPESEGCTLGLVSLPIGRASAVAQSRRSGSDTVLSSNLREMLDTGEDEATDAGLRELEDSVHGQDVKCNDHTGSCSSPDGSIPVEAVGLLRALMAHPKTAPEPSRGGASEAIRFPPLRGVAAARMLWGKELDSGSIVTGFTAKPL
ncbi:hypothetical protein DFH09DRAFT_1093465 [Mycena vulgaris]|nr:hypothetical protein DFH09DRAFT_1093465 [Mycena vulgaris]